MGVELAEWVVTAPGGPQMMLQLAYFDRGRQPVVMDIGPVLDLEDVVGGKVCALASRVEPRDFADAGLRLDQMDDREFAEIGLSLPDVTRLRERLAAWPRRPRASCASDSLTWDLSRARGRMSAARPLAA